jgi:hypothetical protein
MKSKSKPNLGPAENPGVEPKNPTAPGRCVKNHAPPADGAKTSTTASDLSPEEIADIEAEHPGFQLDVMLDESTGPFADHVPSGPAPEFIMPDGKEKNPDVGKNSESIARDSRRDRWERETRFQQGLAPLMAQRTHFCCAEIAAEVARPHTDQHGHLAIKPDPELRREVLKQIRNSILDGDIADITLRGNAFPVTDFREALQAHPDMEGELAFLEFYIEPAYLPRAAAARWLKGRRYPWPPSWGAEPPLEAGVGAQTEARAPEMPAEVLQGQEQPSTPTATDPAPSATPRGAGAHTTTSPTKPGRRSPKKALAMRALEDLYPNKDWPDPSGVIRNQVNKWLFAQNLAPIGPDTLRTAIADLREPKRRPI